MTSISCVLFWLLGAAADAGDVGGADAGLFSASDLVTGRFAVPLPIELPSAEGGPLFDIFPKYSPAFGLSEWGMGWQTSLSISRYRAIGQISFDDDDRFIGPWGPMVKGADGFWYPEALHAMVRVWIPTLAEGEVAAIAYLSDGRVATFGELQTASHKRVMATWSLSRVDDALGRSMHLTYDPDSRANGRALVWTVTYGGDGAQAPAYHIELVYDVANLIDGAVQLSFRSGIENTIAKRVSEVRVSSGAHLRWLYRLTHSNNRHVTSVFYLRTLAKEFPNGERLPPASYYYNDHGAHLAAPRVEEATAITSLLRAEGISATRLLPPKLVPVKFGDEEPSEAGFGAVFLDANEDGLTDLALQKTNHQSNYGALDPLYQFYVRDEAGFRPSHAWTRPDTIALAEVPAGAARLSPASPPVALFVGTMPDRVIENICCVRCDEVCTFLDIGPRCTDGCQVCRPATPERDICRKRQIDFTRTFTIVRDLWTGQRLGTIEVGARQSATRRFNVPVVIAPSFVDVDSDGRLDVAYAGAEYPDGVVVGLDTDFTNDGERRLLTGSKKAMSQYWVADLNADTSTDLLYRYGMSFKVELSRTREMPVVFEGRASSVINAETKFHFVDINKDGLPDLVAVFPLTGHPPALFLNNGSRHGSFVFVEAPSPGLDVAWATQQNVGDVLMQDLSGDGNDHMLLLRDDANGATVTDVLLSEPSAGLLSRIDNGQGVVSELSYGRAASAPRLGSRPVTLAALTVTSNGDATRRQTFTFSNPVLHSKGSGLLGFRSVVATTTDAAGATVGSEESNFLDVDDGAEVHVMMPTTLTSRDATDHVRRSQGTTYDQKQFRGVTWWRPRARRAALYIDGSPALTTELTHVSFLDDEICPLESQQMGGTDIDGNLRSLSTSICYDHTTPGCDDVATQARLPSKLAEGLACVPKRLTKVDRSGSTMVEEFTWNEAGQPVDHFESGLHLEHHLYNGNGTLKSTTERGRFETSYDYDEKRRLLVRRIRRPDKSEWYCNSSGTGECDRDAMTGQLLSAIDGGIDMHTAYDGQERVVAQWSEAQGTFREQPALRFSYQRPTDTLLGVTRQDRLVDAETGAVRSSLAWVSAAGREVARGTSTLAGYAVSRLVTQGETTQTLYARSRALNIDPMRVILPDLLANSAQLQSQNQSPLGLLLGATNTLQDGVDYVVQYSYETARDGLIQRETRPGAAEGGGDLVTQRLLAADGTLSAYCDEGVSANCASDVAGRSTYVHDTLGGLKEARLADGTRIVTCFDAHHRPARIERRSSAHPRVQSCSAQSEAVGLVVRYAYDPVDGSLRTKTFLVDGQALAHEVLGYDDAGRLKTHVHVTGDGAHRVVYSHFYDGANLEEPDVIKPGQLGHLTGIAGPGYAKTFVYGSDGRIAKASINIGGERAVVTASEYFSDGSLKTEVVELLVPSGGQAACLNEGQRRDVFVDAQGRARQVMMHASARSRDRLQYASDTDQAPLFADIAYDELGRVQALALSDGSLTLPLYDGLTQVRSGVRRHLADQSYVSQMTLSKRGEVDTELLESAAGRVTRNYRYDARGRLTTALDTGGAAASFSYGYNDSNGLVTRVGSYNVSRTGVVFGASGTTTTMGAYTTTQDALGRTVMRQEGSSAPHYFLYGADNQIHCTSEHANQCEYEDATERTHCGLLSGQTCEPAPSNAGIVEMIYDERGQRLATWRDGSWQRAWVDGVELDARGLTEPVTLAGVHLGTLHRGSFESLITDMRGTVLAARAASGSSTLPSPYGARPIHADTASATDYVTQPFDADLGLVRLGVRDYDASQAVFMQPDWLYIERPELCLADPVGCNLFSYGHSNPAGYVDRDGRFAELIVGTLLAMGAGAVASYFSTGTWWIGTPPANFDGRGVAFGYNYGPPAPNAYVTVGGAPVPGGGAIGPGLGGEFGNGGWTAGYPTLSPGAFGYAGMVPGGIATTTLNHGLLGSAQALNNLYAGYALTRLGLGLLRFGVNALMRRTASLEVDYAVGEVMANGRIAGMGPGAAAAPELVPTLPANARSTSSVAEVFSRLQTFHGVDPIVASERLHAIKAAAGRGAADNVLFDLTGNVYDPSTRLWLGSLTAP